MRQPARVRIQRSRGRDRASRELTFGTKPSRTVSVPVAVSPFRGGSKTRGTEYEPVVWPAIEAQGVEPADSTMRETTPWLSSACMSAGPTGEKIVLPTRKGAAGKSGCGSKAR